MGGALAIATFAWSAWRSHDAARVSARVAIAKRASLYVLHATAALATAIGLYLNAEEAMWTAPPSIVHIDGLTQAPALVAA